MKTYAYYPGCSLSASGRDYDASVRAVFAALDIELQEIEDWNCCGASSGFLVDQRTFLAYNARNINWAAKRELNVIVPCTGCLKNMRKTIDKLADSEKARNNVAEDLGEPYVQGIKAIHPLEAMINDIGWDTISQKIQNKFKDIKIAPYYGCYLIRPPVEYDRSEDPQALDNLVDLCGAKTVDFAYKTKCCGGGGFLTRESLAIELSADILQHVKTAEADAVLVACPLCDMMLDGYQKRLSAAAGRNFNIPVLYFTQFLGLALGLDDKSLGLNGRLISVDALVARMREAAAQAKADEEKRKAKEAERAAKLAAAKAAKQKKAEQQGAQTQ